MISVYLICCFSNSIELHFFPRSFSEQPRCWWMLTEHSVLNEIMFTHTQAGAFWASIASQYTPTAHFFSRLHRYQQHDIVSIPFIRYNSLPHVYAVDVRDGSRQSVYWNFRFTFSLKINQLVVISHHCAYSFGLDNDFMLLLRFCLHGMVCTLISLCRSGLLKTFLFTRNMTSW